MLRLLREELGFDGVVVSDALDMRAIADRRRPRRRAPSGRCWPGVDLVCIGNPVFPDPYADAEAAEEVVAAVAAGVPGAPTRGGRSPHRRAWPCRRPSAALDDAAALAMRQRVPRPARSPSPATSGSVPARSVLLAPPETSYAAGRRRSSLAELDADGRRDGRRGRSSRAQRPGPTSSSWLRAAPAPAPARSSTRCWPCGPTPSSYTPAWPMPRGRPRARMLVSHSGGRAGSCRRPPRTRSGGPHMIVGVDLGKTGCRARAADGAPVEGAGAPGLAEPGGVDAAVAAVGVVVARLGTPRVTVRGGSRRGGRSRRRPSTRRRARPARIPARRSRSPPTRSRPTPARSAAVPAASSRSAPARSRSRSRRPVAVRQLDGWGPWLGDDGGGAWIGREALRGVLRAREGRGARDDPDLDRPSAGTATSPPSPRPSPTARRPATPRPSRPTWSTRRGR